MAKDRANLAEEIHVFLRNSFRPKFGELRDNFPGDPIWQKMRQLGTELWLDTGNMDEAGKLWTRQFSALTTNNTLLNKEVQTGRYDSLIGDVAKLLEPYQLDEKEQMLEIAFILNAWHGLRLVEKFDAFVSVEEHTDLADNVDSAISCAKRYHAVCPERFIVKIPFTPAGLLATRKVVREGITVNHTLGFSARQNYIIARRSNPNYVNVFLGRLNSFVKENNLGDGSYIGEKATLASQAAIRKLRKQGKVQTKQIGASFREGEQIRDLAGIDVMTMPPKVAEQFKNLNLSPDRITDKTKADYSVGVNNETDIEKAGLDTLWDIPDKLIKCVDDLEKENLDTITADELVEFFAEHDCGDIVVKWSEEQIKTSTEEGKIPKLENWKELLESQKVGLDAIMNLAGLNSFKTDQKAMDDKVRDVLNKTK
ncbi:MAG: transaldolase family protein [Phycisphaerae bacterium]|jgi:transaldolase